MASDGIATYSIPVLSRRTRSWGLLAAVCGVVAVLYLFSPYDSGIYATCPFKALTDFHCPGCGTLRGLYELFHGNLANAFGLNPLMVLVLPFIAYSILKYVAMGILGRKERRVFIPSALIWSLLVVIISFWVLRNLPYYPFTLLAP